MNFNLFHKNANIASKKSKLIQYGSNFEVRTTTVADFVYNVKRCNRQTPLTIKWNEQ